MEYFLIDYFGNEWFHVLIKDLRKIVYSYLPSKIRFNTTKSDMFTLLPTKFTIKNISFNKIYATDNFYFHIHGDIYRFTIFDTRLTIEVSRYQGSIYIPRTVTNDNPVSIRLCTKFIPSVVAIFGSVTVILFDVASHNITELTSEIFNV